MLSLVFNYYHSINHRYPLKIFTNTAHSISFNKRKVCRFPKPTIVPAFGNTLEHAANNFITLDTITP